MCAVVVGAGQLVIRLRGGRELRRECSVGGIGDVPPVTAHQSYSAVADIEHGISAGGTARFYLCVLTPKHLHF